MNKLDIHFRSDQIQAPSNLEPVANGPSWEPPHRLIVLIPPASNYTAATRRVCQLAVTTGMHILLLGVCGDAAEEPTLRRELVTMSALIQDGRLCAEVKVELGTDWLRAARRNYRSGDLLVCFADQRAGLLRQPLSQVLQEKLSAPVYLLAGSSPQDLSRLNWLSQSLVWAGSIGIILGSAILQIRITSFQQDWVQTTLLILSVIGEVWLILGWNSLFS